MYQDLAAQVLPVDGYQSRIALGDSIVKLMRAAVIDRKKLEALYAAGGGAPEELAIILDKTSRQPILIRAKNARLYVNLLWPLGLANRMATNKSSPLNGPSRFNYASTGGWTLGREANGGAYFNAFWFPDHYTHIALYFKVVKGIDWRNVDAKAVLSATYSSASGMQANVSKALQTRGLLPGQKDTDCSA
jgi:hypothetical protein